MKKTVAIFLIFIITLVGCGGPQKQYSEENCPYPDDSYNEEQFCEDDDKKKKKSKSKKSSKKR